MATIYYYYYYKLILQSFLAKIYCFLKLFRKPCYSLETVPSVGANTHYRIKTEAQLPTGPFTFHTHFVVLYTYGTYIPPSLHMIGRRHVLVRVSAERAVMEGLQLSWKRRGWRTGRERERERGGGRKRGRGGQFVLLLKVTWQGEAPPPSPRYHRFNRLELLLRSVTTKWLQRLRRRREPAERFMVGCLISTLCTVCSVGFRASAPTCSHRGASHGWKNMRG